MQLEQLAFCLTHRRRSVNGSCDYYAQVSASKSIALFLCSACMMSALCPVGNITKQKVLSPGWSPPSVSEGQGSHTWLGTTASSISSQGKEQRHTLP